MATGGAGGTLPAARKKDIMGTRERIGVVGGLGPYAGLDLVRKIFDRTKADQDQDHLSVMLYSFPSGIPVRPEFLLGQTTENPGEAIGDIMAALANAGATIIGMPCNTAHSPIILDTALQRLKATGRVVRFVHIIKAAVNHMRRICPPGSRVGLMGTVATLRTRLYQEALERAGFVPVILDDEGCARVQDAIANREYGIKASSLPVSHQARAILLEAARTLTGQDVAALLLGCTEIPLALTESSLFNVPVIDATSVLAQELIRAADPDKLRFPDF